MKVNATPKLPWMASRGWQAWHRLLWCVQRLHQRRQARNADPVFLPKQTTDGAGWLRNCVVNKTLFFSPVFFFFFLFDVDHFKSLYWICYNIAPVLCFGFLVPGHVGSRPRIEPSCPALDGEVLTTGPLGKSQQDSFCNLSNWRLGWPSGKSGRWGGWGVGTH